MSNINIAQDKYVTLVEFNIKVTKESSRDRNDYHLGKYLFEEIYPWIESQGFSCELPAV